MSKLAGDHVQVLIGGYELTTDSQRVTLNDSYAMHDVTTFGDAARKFLTGQRKTAIMHTGYMEAAAGRSHPVLKGAEVQGAFSAYLGRNAAPAVGDPVFNLTMIQGKYAVLPETNRFIPFAAAFAAANGQGGWGIALTPPVSFTSTTTGSATDNGSATNSGGVAFLHLLQAAAADRYAIVVEGAPNAAFSSGVVTLATFTLDASAIGSQRIPFSGAVPQYVRWKATRTGSANNQVKAAVSFIRF